MKVQKLKKNLRIYWVFFPRDLGFRSHYGKGQKSPLYLNILASPSGSQIYYLVGHVSWYKEPFIFGLLMGQFPGRKTNRVDESPVTPPPPYPGFQPQGRPLFFIQGLLGRARICAGSVSFWLFQGPAQLPLLLGGLVHDPGWNLSAPIPPLVAPFFLLVPVTGLFLMICILTHQPRDPNFWGLWLCLSHIC